MTSTLRLLAVPGAMLAAGLLAGGCGGSATKQQAHTAVPVVSVTEADFHIEAPSTLRAGRYTLRVHNGGPTVHELLIAPVRGGSLPLRADGLTVNEEAFQRHEPGALEPGGPGAVRKLTVQLKPGRYVFFCNMEGHYMAGMHATVDVS